MAAKDVEEVTAASLCFLNLFSDGDTFVMNSFFKKRKDPISDVALLKALIKTKAKKRKCNLKFSHYGDRAFKACFRMSRSTVQTLIETLPPLSSSNVGRPALVDVNPQSVILLCLWTLGNQESFRDISHRFRFSQGVAYREFIRFCKKVCKLQKRFIRWPRDGDAVKVQDEFASLQQKSFPDVIGCIDCIHIATSVPKSDRDIYSNKKNFTSVILQGVCNARLQFQDVYAGCPGSCDVATVWSSSLLYQEVQERRDCIPDGAHLLGDTTFPLSSCLMTPYYDDGLLTEEQKLFNLVLFSTRLTIKQTFARLLGRFRRLRHLYIFRKDRIPLVILSGCILHNLCIEQNDDMPEDYIEVEDDDFVSSFIDGSGQPSLEVAPADALLKRDAIAKHLFTMNYSDNVKIH